MIQLQLLRSLSPKRTNHVRTNPVRRNLDKRNPVRRNLAKTNPRKTINLSSQREKSHNELTLSTQTMIVTSTTTTIMIMTSTMISLIIVNTDTMPTIIAPCIMTGLMSSFTNVLNIPVIMSIATGSSLTKRRETNLTKNLKETQSRLKGKNLLSSRLQNQLKPAKTTTTQRSSPSTVTTCTALAMWPTTRHTSSWRTRTTMTERTRAGTCTARKMSSTTIVGTTCYRLLRKKRRIANKTTDKRRSSQRRQATGRISELVTSNNDRRKNTIMTTLYSSTTDHRASHDYNDTYS